MLVAMRRQSGRGQCIPDLARRDFAKMQMWRQPRGTDPTGDIALYLVATHGIIEKHTQRFVRARLARLPMWPESGIPLRPCRQSERIDGEIGRAAWRERVCQYV